MDWNNFDRGVFLLNVLAIIIHNGEILIGRRENDPYIKELTWCFPGGRPGYDDDLETYLKIEIMKKTNLEIAAENVLFAKTYPEDRRFLSIYYLCSPLTHELLAGEKFVEVKWVKPEDLNRYFTTSLHPRLLELIKESTNR